MDRSDYASADYAQPTVPPGTPPVIEAGGDTYTPDQQPNEVPPQAPDRDQPSQTPDEVGPGQGDFDSPDRAPAEVPPQPGTAPTEMPPPD
jgi:hypothetical protein